MKCSFINLKKVKNIFFDYHDKMVIFLINSNKQINKGILTSFKSFSIKYIQLFQTKLILSELFKDRILEKKNK